MHKFTTKEKLILSDATIGLECKTWILLNSVALHDDELMQQLHDGKQLWKDEHTGGSLPPGNPWYFKQEWFISNAKTQRQQENEFYCLIGFHVDSIVNSDYFSVAKYQTMGLGLMAKVNSTVDDIAEEIPGYLEIISEALFETLQILGHNSLYKFKDTDNIPYWCILYGPLSLVNSKPHIPIGFLQCNPTTHIELYYEFEYIVFKTRYPQILTRTYDISATPFDETNRRPYSTPRHYTNRNPNHPTILHKTIKKELVQRVKMSWKGKTTDHTEARSIRAGEQVFINYKYVDIPEPQYIDLTNSDEEDREEDDY